ncbi:MAG TPA: right-handed parallel beta-helix repeat-containing protein, partial [Tepidisphaeraceae bacterium]|nr:right-handed parallel beta-helix repeat-containing protein [Tepidisphaeraceae bacterium]
MTHPRNTTPRPLTTTPATLALGTRPGRAALRRAVVETMEARRLFAAYYFDPTVGNDANPTNTPSTPWATIAKANTLDLNAGDQLLFKGGKTFGGSLSLTAEDGGTAANPVVVGSYGTGRATIDAGAGEGVGINNVAGIRVQDLVVAGGWKAATQSGNTKNGISAWVDLPGNVKLDYLHVNNVEVYGFKNDGIKIQGWATDSSYSGFKNVLIENTTSHDNGGGGMKSGGMYTSAINYSHQNFTVRYCTTYNNKGIWDNDGSGNGIVLAGIDGVTIERCVAYGNGGLNKVAGGGPVGIWVWDVTNGLIQYCESYNNTSAGGDGGGFDFDGGAVNSVMQYNYSHDNKGPGYLVYDFGNRPVTNNVIRYNVSRNDGYGMLIGSGNQTIYNNTIHTNKGTGISLWSGTHKIFNNVIASSGNQLYAASSASSSQINGNAYYKINGGLSIVWGAASGVSSTGSTTYTNLPAFTAATAKEANGLNVNPLMVNPAGAGTAGDASLLTTIGGYKLQSGSPLINAGLNLTAGPFNISVGTRDYYGNALPQGGSFDIGAHEFANDSAAPSLAANTGATVPQGKAIQFTPAMLSATDAVSTSPDAVTYRVTSLPTRGTLTKGDVPLAVNGTFTQQDLIDGRVAYANTSSAGNDAFGFVLLDNAANASAAGTFAITVQPLAAPANFAATGGDARVSLAWSAVTDATGYVVWYGTSPGTYTASMALGAGTLAVDITDLTAGTSYYFTVVATNAAGAGSSAAEVASAYAPRLLTWQVNDGSNQRSMVNSLTFTF